MAQRGGARLIVTMGDIAMGEEWSDSSVYILIFVMVALVIGLGVLAYGSMQRN